MAPNVSLTYIQTTPPRVQASLIRFQRLGQQAAEMKAARVLLDAGITPEQAAQDAQDVESFPWLAPIAAAMAELAATP